MSDGPSRAEFAALCADVIGIPTISAQENFFDAGGDSISAARLAVEVDERWACQIDVFEIFMCATIEDIHRGLRESTHID